MKSFLLLLMTSVLLTLAVNFSALAQCSFKTGSTKTELLQIRQAVDLYVDHIKGSYYRSSDINWEWSDITRCDLDGKPGLEAIVHIGGEGLCGASACDNAIIVWRNGRAQVIGVINDSILSVSSVMSRGMYDLLGHYYSHRWNGKEYEPYCEKGSDSVCERNR